MPSQSPERTESLYTFTQQTKILSQFYYLVAACAYGTLEDVKSLQQAFQKTKDPLPKMSDTATPFNRPDIAEYRISAGSRVIY